MRGNTMYYKKCPKCNLNDIPFHKECCDVCKMQEARGKTKTMNTEKTSNKNIDYSKIVRGYAYGTSTKKIYEQFCESLGWDKSKVNQFGWQTPLYAMNADTDRTRDVWFICYPNYDVKKLENVAESGCAVNLIKDGGDTIVEVVDEKFGASNKADRITFAKNEKGKYIFLGVYTLVQNGTIRVHKRISDTYPII